MASEIQIINLALTKLGTDRIGSRSEASKPAREADAVYNLVRDSELRTNTWRFSVKRTTLSALTTTPAFQYAYEYQLPTDCLRVIQVGEYYATSLTDYRTGDEAPFAIEGRKILTDLAAPLALRYVRRIADTDAQDIDSAFVQALACKLAFEICEAITGSTTKQDSLARQYGAAIGEASLANALEVAPAAIADDFLAHRAALMAKASPAQNSFAGGELSPLLEGRQDLEKYPVGCRRQRNFFPMIQGPARKRGGTLFIAEVKDSADRTWLRSFRYSTLDSVVIEYGDGYNRFYTDRGTIEAVPGTPYEIVSPFAVADLVHAEGSFNLSQAQSGDVVYTAQGDGTYAPRTLSRTSNISWAWATYQPNDGPFDPQNIDTAVSVETSGVTGSVTLTNDANNVPVNETTDVGRLIRIEETDKSAIKPWEASKRIAAEGANPNGELRRSDGKVYQCATNSTVAAGQIEYRTGSIRPIHSEGTEGDGDGKPLYSGSTLFAGKVGVDWTYLHAGYGVGRVTAVAAGGATATVNTLSRWPASVDSPGSYRWSRGSWYGANYPTCCGFFRERLAWAGKQRVYLSVSASYDSHAPDEFGEVVADSAINILVGVGDQDQINWLVPQTDAMLIGTGGSEIALHEISRSQVFAPANCKFEPQASYGSRRVAPLNIAEMTLYVQAGGRKVREAQYSADSERYVARDVTAFAEHITRSGIVDTAYAKNPYSIVWHLRADGKLAALTYSKDEGVEAWSLHDVGGVVESIAVIPGPDGITDDLWMVVRRTINGATKRYIEVLLQPYESPDDPHTANGQDCSLTYDGAQAVTLTPGTGATAADTTGVTFTSGIGHFTADDIGREIRVRWLDEDAEDAATGWLEACAVIDAYVAPDTVTCSIVSAFPSLATLAAGAWRLTATEISGLDHLEGQTVRVVADGAAHSNRVVASGAITLERPGALVHVGLPVRGVVQLMNLEAGAADGTAQGKIKKIITVTFRLFETLGGQFGRSSAAAHLDAIQFRSPGDAMTQALPLFTGDKTVAWNNGYETDGRVTFVHDEGFPCTLCAVFPQLATNDQRTGGTGGGY